MQLDGKLDASVGEDAVQFIYRVDNVGDAPAHLQFRSGKRYDISVSESETGDPIWRASEGRVYTQAIGSLSLAPGESVSFDDRMDTPSSGAYEAVATLAAEEEDAPATTTFHVP